MAKIKYLIIFAVFLLITPEVFAESECGGIMARENTNYDRSWVKSEKPLYLVKDNKIYKTGFNTNDLTLLADHAYIYISQFKLSPDSHYIYYNGHIGGGRFTQYLYDLTTNEDYRLTTPERITHSEFSPDSKKIILLNNNVKERQENFIVMNLEDKSFESVIYPIDIILLKDFRGVTARWSLDARYIYLGAISYPEGAYYKYDVESKQMIKIDGKYISHRDSQDYKDLGIHYIEEQKELQFYRQPCLQWSCGNQGKAMKGVNAKIDKDHRLKVTTPEGREIIVDKGEYDNCEGVTIRVLSWVENGKYLIYQHPYNITYIYGVEGNKKSVLFDSDAIRYFGWEENENRRFDIY